MPSGPQRWLLKVGDFPAGPLSFSVCVCVCYIRTYVRRTRSPASGLQSGPRTLVYTLLRVRTLGLRVFGPVPGYISQL